MSTLTYNGVTLPFVETIRLEQTPVFDPTHTDYLYTKTTIQVRSWLTGIRDSAGNPVIPADLTDNNSPAATAKRIEEKLRQKRKPLVYATDAGTTLLATTGIDDANGPTPFGVSVTYVTAGTYQIEFGASVCVRTSCPSGYVFPWLSFRWGEAESINDRWLRVRRRFGVLHLSSRTFQPDSFRGLVTPAIPYGFERVSANYTLSDDGLTYSFQFTDQQVQPDAMPPGEAIKMRGAMVEEIIKYGAIRRAHMNLSLEGSPGMSKQYLLRLAIRVAFSRIFPTAIVADTSTGKILVSGRIGEEISMTENRVNVSFTWHMKHAKARDKAELTATVPPPPDPNLGQPPQTTELVGTPFPGATVNDTAGALLGGAGLAALSVGDQSELAINAKLMGVEVAAPEQVPPPPDVPKVPSKTPEGADKDGVQYADWVGMPIPGSNPNRGIAPPLYGLGNAVRLASAVLGDPCGQTAELRPGVLYNSLVGTSVGGSFQVTAAISNRVPSDLEALYSAEEILTPGVLDEYTIEAFYTHKTGWSGMPSTKAGEPEQKIRLHNPRCWLKIQWSARKIGSPPKIPDPEYQPPELIPLGGTVLMSQMDLAADGVSVVYSNAGVVEYLFKDATKATFANPVPPFLDAVLKPKAGDSISVRDHEIAFPLSLSGGGNNPFVTHGTTSDSGTGGGDF